MTNELLASKVVIQEEQPRIRNIQGVATAVAVALGVTEKGPVSTPVLTTSGEEWTKVFGGHIVNSDLASQVEGFYNNNPGGQLWTVRIVHYTDVSSSATKTSVKATEQISTGTTAPSSGTILGTSASPFAMSPNDTLIASIDGAGNQTATFLAAAATRDSVAGPYVLADGQTLTVIMDSGSLQTITVHTSNFVAIGAATAAEVAAVINSQLVGGSASVVGGAVRITSDSRGTGSHVHVTGGSANAALTFSTVTSNGTGNVANILAVTAAEVIAVLAAVFVTATITQESGHIRIRSNTTGASSSVHVINTSVGTPTELGFDFATHSGATGAALPTIQFDGKYDGTYANALSVAVLASSSGNPDAFNLEVLSGALIVERFPNLSMDDTNPRYLETIFNDPDNGSQLLQATDLELAGTTNQRRPANGTFGPLTTGNDGLTSLGDTDFIGDPAGGTGLRALDQTLGLRILTIPGQATAAIHNAMITYAEIIRSGEMFAVLDSPAGLTAVQVQTYVVTTAALRGLSEFGAIYWPRIKVLNPSVALFGNVPQIVVAPSLHIAGMYGRVDGSKPGGVYVPPAGEATGRLVGALGVETNEVLDEGKRDVIFPDLINPIAIYPGTPVHCDGARTLKDNGNFPTIGERRGVIFIEQSIKDFLRASKHKANNDDLRAAVERSVLSFMIVQMNNDAFQTKNPNTAFLVDVSSALNPPSVVFARQLKIRLGVATNKPAEFIILLVSQDTRALEQELAQAAA